MVVLTLASPEFPQFASAQEPESVTELAIESNVDEAAAPIKAEELSYVLNNAVIFFCAVLVLFIQAGFAMVEVGLNSSKNVVNILFKNLMDLSIGAILFFVVGFAIMYPGNYLTGDLNPFFAFGGFGIYAASEGASLAPHADWFFGAVFAATVNNIAVTKTLAACAIVSTLISWTWLTKPDSSISLIEALIGLVGITAVCDCFLDWWSMVIGACAGALVVAGVRLLDRLHIDDPVGAWPVDGLCGIWRSFANGFIPTELPGMMGMPIGYGVESSLRQHTRSKPSVLAGAEASAV